MKKILTLFDYVFFRIYRFWVDQGDIVPETKGFLFLSLIQFLTLLDIVALIQHFTGYDNMISKLTFAPILVGIAFINYFRYYKDFDSKDWIGCWGDEPKQTRIRNGWFIGLYLLMALLFPVVYGYLKHNLHLI